MKSINVMIVEDEVISAMEIKDSIESMGFCSVVSVVGSGDEAIIEAKNKQPDIVLMDIKLPGHPDGIEASAIIKDRYQIPTIYLTAFNDDETINRAKKTQPLNYLIKPIQDQDLRVAIELGVYLAEVEREKSEIMKKLEKNREELLKLSLQLINTQEEERKKISQELHDEVGQALTATQINLEVIEKLLCYECAESISTRLSEAIDMNSRILEQIRELSLNLRPSMLDELGLIPTLNWYITRFSKRTEIDVNFDFTESKHRFSPEIETTIYRIAQEALTNVAKHANADQIDIEMKNDNNSIQITIEDNGEGFDVSDLEKLPESGQGIGLIGLRERVLILNGQFQLNSKQNRGTTIKIALPILQ